MAMLYEFVGLAAQASASPSCGVYPSPGDSWGCLTVYKEAPALDNPGLTFNDTWPGGLAGLNTAVSVGYDDEALTILFNVQRSVVQQNAFDVCNEDVYNQEVVEVFITGNNTGYPWIAKPEHYFEVELTPKGTPWIGLDYNPGGDRENLTHVLQPCDSVKTAVIKRTANSWVGEMRLPFSLIGNGTYVNHGNRLFRVNFFRVTMNPDQWAGKTVTRDMPCGPSNCTYTCASCPNTTVPDFHHTLNFGTLIITEGGRPCWPGAPLADGCACGHSWDCISQDCAGTPPTCQPPHE